MKKLLSALLVFAFMSMAYAVFEVKVVNEIDDKDDPIKVKSFNFTIGKIKGSSHQEGEEIGEEFKVKVDLPSIQHMFPVDYFKSLEEDGKQLDSITLGNSTREFTFTLFLGTQIFLKPIVKENISVYALGSSRGFQIAEPLEKK